MQDEKLINLFQQLNAIKAEYVELSVSSLDKRSRMSFTEYKTDYEYLGEIVNSEKFRAIQTELIEEVIYSILEMLDGYKGLNFDIDIIDKKTGESIIKDIQMHDRFRDFLVSHRRA